MPRDVPLESQWDLLAEHNLSGRFDAAWIDTKDVDEIAQRFRADRNSGILCDLVTAFNTAQPATIRRTPLYGSGPILRAGPSLSL